MSLPEVLHRPGYITEAVTHLQLLSQPDLPAAVFPAGFTLEKQSPLSPATYLPVFKGVGVTWLWQSHLNMPEAKLAALLADPAHHVHFLKHQGRNIGLSEIHVSEDGDVEIVYFGIESNYTGQGLGPIMMAATLLYAWQLPGVQRVWLHTSTNDHPMAQTFYKKIGFVPFKTSIDQFKDPRLAGHYPRDAGKHIPLCDATHAC